jgi:hypothetical protein
MAYADSMEPVVTVECQPANNIVVIYYYVVPSDFNFASGVGTYRPGALIEVTQVGERVYVNRTLHTDHVCKLGVGTVRVRIEPHVFNYNVLGRCGAAISAKVRVSRGRTSLLNHTFQTHCFDREPPVSRIHIEARTGRVHMSRDEVPELLNSE